MEEVRSAQSRKKKRGRALDMETLLSLRQPTVRVPMHSSPDGALLTISSQSKRRTVAPMEPTGVSRSKNYPPGETAGSKVIVVDTASGEAFEPFGAIETSWGGQWSPNGKLLAAYLTHNGEPYLAVWRRDQVSIRLFDQAPVRPYFGFEVPRWTPDSSGIVVKLAPGAETGEEPEQQPPSPQGTGNNRTPGIKVFSFEPAVDKTNALSLPAWSGSYVCDLGLVDVESNEVRRLASGWPLTGWKVAPDGSALAVLKDVGADITLQQSYFDLVVVPLPGSGGGEPRTIAQRVPQSYGICFNWSPDSKRIAYTTRKSNQPGRLFVARADGSDAPVELTEPSMDMGLEQDYEAPRWTADGRHIACLAEDGVCIFAAGASNDDSGNSSGIRRTFRHPPEMEIVSWVQSPSGAELWQPQGQNALLVLTRHLQTKDTGLLKIDLASGASELLFQVEARWHGWTFGVETVPDGSGYYLLLEAAHHPSEVWHAPSTDSTGEGSTLNHNRPARLFSLNPSLENVALGTSHIIEYRALDGEVRQAAVLLPAGYKEGQRLPLIVEVYGGMPGSETRHVFGGSEMVCNWQWLAAQGYGVLQPDMPLAGNDRMRQLPGLVLPAIDKLIEMGIADPGRLAVMGHSYGGYCTLALITQTTRFRAAVATSCPVDLISAYGTLTENGDSRWLGWTESGQGAMGGSLWEKRQAYIENSPLFYLDRVETPVLLSCGTRNQEEPAQAGEAFSALRRLGKSVEVRFYEGEDHWAGEWSERNLRDLYSAICAWFDRYLK